MQNAIHLEEPGAQQEGVTRLEEYATPEALAKQYPHLFTLPQIRWALRFRDENGLGEHVTRLGRRIYIHKPGFAEWFRWQAEKR